MDDAYEIYRKTLTSMEDEQSCWWYLGTTTVQPEGHTEFIVNHVETVMVYDALTLDEQSYRIPWWEIGVFRDAITGEEPTEWVNPMTGLVNPAPKIFEEGPSAFSVRATPDGRAEIFDAVQAFAQLDTAEVKVEEMGDRVSITQTEFKIRSFPNSAGLPDLDAGESSRAKTVLQWFASKADIASDMPSVPASGYYSLEIACPAWLGFGDIPVRFMVKGIMHKAPMNMPLNRRGWSGLKDRFPHYFLGDVIQPNWGLQ